MKTIRFWQWINDGPVKITIKPDQILTHQKFCRHDEGWSSEENKWQNFDGALLNHSVSDGRDCDGRMTQKGLYKRTELNGIRDHENKLHEGKPIFYPKWDRVSSSQRDEFAEAMNY